MSGQLTLRGVCTSEQPFLYAVYASTREEELAPLAWSDEQKTLFLRMQFDAQHRYYHDEFPNAAFQIILVDDRPVGRLYVDRRSDELRLIDIALLPSDRNRGIGRRLLGSLIDEAQRDGKRIRIHVEQNNPARRLYERLGFETVSRGGIYDLLEWRPVESSE